MAASITSRSVSKIKGIFVSLECQQTSAILMKASKLHARNLSSPTVRINPVSRQDFTLKPHIATPSVTVSGQRLITNQRLLSVCKCDGFRGGVPLPLADTPCWRCGANNQHPKFCEKCGVIQPAQKDANYFEVLGFPVDFSLNVKELTKRFHELQAILHPDKFAQKSEEERAFSAAQSSLVNKSYQTLLKPLPRGLYLLELHGASMEEDEVHLDPTFLMEIMEANELLAEVDDLDTLHKMGRDNHQTLTELMAQATEAFADGNIEKAKESLARLKYYVNIDDKVQDFVSRFGEQD